MDIEDLCILYAICRYRIRYAIPGALGALATFQPRLSDRSRRLVLDPLASGPICPHALSCCSKLHILQNLEFSCLLRPCPGMYCLRRPGRGRVLISSCRNASDLVMVHTISVKYAFSTVTKNSKQIYGHSINYSAGYFKSKHWHS